LNEWILLFFVPVVASKSGKKKSGKDEDEDDEDDDDDDEDEEEDEEDDEEQVSLCICVANFPCGKLRAHIGARLDTTLAVPISAP
jgi:hypothetical protein